MNFSSKAIAACAVAVLVCIGLVSFRNIVQDEEDRGWVSHTHLVLEKCQSVLVDINQAETGQRGYTLTGEELYLEPYQVGVDQIDRNLAEVQRLTADNPKQQTAVKELKVIVDARLALLAAQIEIRRRAGSMAGVAIGNGEAVTNEIRLRVKEMQLTEERLLSIRLEAAAASSRRTKIVIVLGNALAIFILSMAGFVIWQEAAKRSLAEKELRKVNDHLENRTAELSDANKALESFSYSVAHDLRAPLRQIAGYSNVLIQDYGASLDSEARRYLEKLEEGARKMGRLVDDLLGLSKIGRQELELQTIELSSLLRQVVEDLAPECSGRKVEWQLGSLSSAECDSGLMKQVFTNLLSNAVKYTGKRERAVIQVGQTTQGGLRTIFVRDNGVGFEMQYVGKLFGVFQRLHKARDFEGTGVGLAIVQRIIRKHGGKIWVEAEIDRGATFFFTLGSPEGDAIKELEPAIQK